MPHEDSIQLLIEEIRGGDDDAVKVLWDGYFPRIVGLAAQRLRGERARQAGEEDVALSVMESMVVALRKGRMTELDSRDGLWRLLAAMTRRKVIDLVRHNKVRPQMGESGVYNPTDDGPNQGLDILPGNDLPPEMAVEIDAEWNRLIGLLPREEYREAALKRLEGYTVKEIAQQRNCHITTVERQLRIVRKHWEKELGTEGDLNGQ